MASIRTRIAVIDWQDSCTDTGWKPLDQQESISKIKSVGILLRENRTEVVIATSKSGFGRVLDQLAIPKACITKIKRRYV